jgi:hypothetical protein
MKRNSRPLRPGVNKCPFVQGPNTYTMTNTVGADISTIGPHWRVGSIEVGGG